MSWRSSMSFSLLQSKRCHGGNLRVMVSLSSSSRPTGLSKYVMGIRTFLLLILYTDFPFLFWLMTEYFAIYCEDQLSFGSKERKKMRPIELEGILLEGNFNFTLLGKRFFLLDISCPWGFTNSGPARGFLVTQASFSTNRLERICKGNLHFRRFVSQKNESLRVQWSP